VCKYTCEFRDNVYKEDVLRLCVASSLYATSCILLDLSTLPPLIGNACPTFAYPCPALITSTFAHPCAALVSLTFARPCPALILLTFACPCPVPHGQFPCTFSAPAPASAPAPTAATAPTPHSRRCSHSHYRFLFEPSEYLRTSCPRLPPLQFDCLGTFRYCTYYHLSFPHPSHSCELLWRSLDSYPQFDCHCHIKPPPPSSIA